MLKKKIINVLLSLAIILALSGLAEAASATKPISITYRNIQLYVNGKAITVQPDEEPFIYGGRTFVPIRLISEAMGQSVEWIDTISTVKITGQGGTQTDNAALLAQKDKEIQDLKLQLQQKNTEIQNLNNKITSLQDDDSAVIKDLEDDLVSDYDELEDVQIDDISLDGDEDEVDVDIEVDLGDYADEWEDLTDSDIKNWIGDMVGDIQDELSDDTEVNGKITDIDSDDVLVDFSKDGDDDLDVDFNDDDYRDGGSGASADDVEDSLDGDSFEVGTMKFYITYINYSGSNVTVTLEARDNNAASYWNSLGSSTRNADIKSICKEIADTFEDDADITPRTIYIDFIDEDNNHLNGYDYDVSDRTLD
jgi:hypothetical protein